MIDFYNKVRQASLAICDPLETEDFGAQPEVFVSPPKWHLAHTTWFFETFVLIPFLEGYSIFNDAFNFLFNSYYNALGDRVARGQRGSLTRPLLKEVLAYRNFVDEHINKLLKEKGDEKEVRKRIEIGLHHEQQHQELMYYDIKYTFGMNPLKPIYGQTPQLKQLGRGNGWLDFDGQITNVGATEQSFSFDNERPQHKVYTSSFSIANELVSNAYFLEFVEDKGYKRPELWLSDGWDWITSNKVEHPLYWQQKQQVFWEYELDSYQELDLSSPVKHVSFYEADAFARWAGKRLPTEFEWERASKEMNFGTLWEWTSSAYLPYPNSEVSPGALGEYNAKFMVNQKVLRGGSWLSPENHVRNTYRNFFSPESRWMFSGIRLAK